MGSICIVLILGSQLGTKFRYTNTWDSMGHGFGSDIYCALGEIDVCDLCA